MALGRLCKSASGLKSISKATCVHCLNLQVGVAICILPSTLRLPILSFHMAGVVMKALNVGL